MTTNMTMTPAHLDKTLRLYRDRWSRSFAPERINTDDLFPIDYRAKAMRHAMWMCERSLEFVANHEIDKAHRWLGFIQGVLWACGHYTIDEMRAHSIEPHVP